MRFGLLGVVLGAVVLSGCVVSPQDYSNVELVRCAHRGKVFMRNDSFGLCSEELAKRMEAGKVTRNEMIVGGMGTAAEIARISAAATIASSAVVSDGLQNQSVGVHAD